MNAFGPKLQIALFIMFLTGGGGLLLARGTGKMSELENRTLAPLPQLSRESVLSGDYFRKLDDYTADHIGLRDHLVGVSKRVASWYGRPGHEETAIIRTEANNTSTVQGTHEFDGPLDPLASKDLPSDTKAIKPGAESSSAAIIPPPEMKGRVMGKVLIQGDRAMNLFRYDRAAATSYALAITAIVQKLSEAGFADPPVRVSVLLAPTAAELLTSPKLRAMSDSQEQAIHDVYNELGPGIHRVDVLDPLRLQAGRGKELYFRTDHHWTAAGAHCAYNAYMNSIGVQPRTLSSYETEDVPGFLGSLYQATLNSQLQQHPDTIRLYKPNIKHVYTVHYTGSMQMPLLDKSHATKKNKYRIFLSGDRPWGDIVTEVEGDRSIAVVKDSYGNAFIPFLLPHYHTIYVIDPRQFTQSISSFVKKHRIGELLFLNNSEVTSDNGFAEQLQKLK
jgi:hypothetical protein